MDYSDYIQNLSDLDNQELKNKLETFYTLNYNTFEFFVAINGTIKKLLQQPQISPNTIKQLENKLPLLIKLKIKIQEFNYSQCAMKLRPSILSVVERIKTSMLLNEVEETLQQFNQLLENNSIIFANEQREKEVAIMRDEEGSIATVSDAEMYFSKYGLDCCNWRTLKFLAKNSTDNKILRIISNAVMDSEELNDIYNDEFWLNHEYQPYSIARSILLNPNTSIELRRSIQSEIHYMESELMNDSRTSLVLKNKLEEKFAKNQKEEHARIYEENKKLYKKNILQKKSSNKGFYIIMAICFIVIVVCFVLKSNL